MIYLDKLEISDRKELHDNELHNDKITGCLMTSISNYLFHITNQFSIIRVITVFIDSHHYTRCQINISNKCCVDVHTMRNMNIYEIYLKLVLPFSYNECRIAFAYFLFSVCPNIQWFVMSFYECDDNDIITDACTDMNPSLNIPGSHVTCRLHGVILVGFNHHDYIAQLLSRGLEYLNDGDWHIWITIIWWQICAFEYAWTSMVGSTNKIQESCIYIVTLLTIRHYPYISRFTQDEGQPICISARTH